jgi:hypothetical protein
MSRRGSNLSVLSCGRSVNLISRLRLLMGATACAGVLLAPPTLTAARAQGQALPDVKVSLPPPPSFDIKRPPIQYDGGAYSIYGLRKSMSKVLDKDVQVKAFLLEIYQCPEETRKCNEAADQKAKQKARATKRKGMAAAEPPSVEPSECRPCDQPHFFLGDTADGKKERALVVADYPVKDWKTGKPKEFKADLGKEYVVTGTFAINSITGFAASNGLIIHKTFEDLEGKMLLEGNAVLPPDAQVIELEGKAPKKLLQE